MSVGKDHPEAGYIATKELRDYMGTEECDAMFRKKMLLNREDTENIVSNGVWANFQPKFDITLQLYNYYPFFERIVRHIIDTHVEQNVWIVEFRHIFGMVIDEDYKPIGVERELEIFDRVLAQVREVHPDFQMRIINCGLKAVPGGHCQTQVDYTIQALKHEKYRHMIAGYDMVMEEEICDPIETFFDMIHKARTD